MVKPAPRAPSPSSAETLAWLHAGEITLQGQFIPGSNYTFLVQVSQGDGAITAVYKPIRGEMPLWDFPEATLARREVAAYRVSQALGWELVPATTLREGPLGMGSLQAYVAHDGAKHYFSFPEKERRALKNVAVFDLLVNNADRKGSHVLRERGTRHMYAIDHGLCFHSEDKLRTVIWEFAGEPIPPALLADLRRLQQGWNGAQALPDLLAAEEIEALNRRLERLLADPVFPMPPEDRRAYPFPPL